MAELRNDVARSNAAVPASRVSKDGARDGTDQAGQAGFSSVLAQWATGQAPAMAPLADEDTVDSPLPAWAQGGDLAAAGHMPWMSLVAQTAQLDGKADNDLRQGLAGDWLSGRAGAAQAELRATQGGAHGAFMAAQSTPQQGLAALPQAMAPEAELAQAPVPGEPAMADKSWQELDTEEAPRRGAELAGAAQRAPAPEAAHAQRGQAALAGGMVLHGMAAVVPEQWRSLAKSARETQAAGAVTAANASAETAVHGQAVAGALGAAHAGQQPGGQAMADTAQAQPGQAEPSDREQQISEQVAFWVHQKSQNAKLTIEHGGRPIQVQVSLQGNEAHVRFDSDEASARDLRDAGAESLRLLLQAQGLQLSGVTVQAHVGQGAGQAGAQAQGQAGGRQARVHAALEPGERPAGRARSSSAGPGGVDLFV